MTSFDVVNAMGPEAIEVLREWHDQLEYCAANSEGLTCCVDDLLEAAGLMMP